MLSDVIGPIISRDDEKLEMKCKTEFERNMSGNLRIDMFHSKRYFQPTDKAYSLARFDQKLINSQFL